MGMGSSPRRRAAFARDVASALLLGLLLFLLVDGGWTEPPGLYAYASLDAIFVFSVRNPLLRRAAIALIVCHGFIALAKPNEQRSAIAADYAQSDSFDPTSGRAHARTMLELLSLVRNSHVSAQNMLASRGLTTATVQALRGELLVRRTQ